MRHIRVLLAIERSRSISGAAEQLHISQPAVSKTLTEIESLLQAKLFDRSAQGIYPTVYGDALLRRCRVIDSELRKADEDLAAINAGFGGHVTVGAYLVSLPQLIPSAISLLRKRVPSITLKIVEGGSTRLESALLSGEVDLVVGRTADATDSIGLVREALCSESFCVIAGAGHPLAQRSAGQAPSCAEMIDYPWVLPPPDSVAYTSILRLFNDCGLDAPGAKLETVSFPLIRTLLQDQRTIAVMPYELVAHDHELGKLAILAVPLPNARSPVSLIFHSERERTPACDLFIECLREAASIVGRTQSI